MSTICPQGANGEVFLFILYVRLKLKIQLLFLDVVYFRISSCFSAEHGQFKTVSQIKSQSTDYRLLQT